MYTSSGINLYEDELNIKYIIKKARLEDTDEALNICDLTRVVNKFDEWKSLMPRIKPFYAVKCNDDNVIVKTLADIGANFDCASKNEIKQVLELGVNPERIIFANPCKPSSHMNYARENNITTGTVDNEFEIYKIYKNYPDSNLVIRFRCEAKKSQRPLGDKFGCDVYKDATTLMLNAKSLQLNVTGASFHVGSGCKDFSAYDRAISLAKNIFKFGKLLGFDMRVLDIGGGFPGNDDCLFKMIADTVNLAVNKHFPDDKTEIIAEPGRYFVASAYTLICKINAKREVRTDGKLDTKMYFLNDGVYGSFNCIIYNNHQQVTAIHFLDDENENLPKFKTLIWGPTCDALDKITENLYLPNLSCGDYIGFPNMGAYTIPIASTFNGFSLPKTLYFMRI